MISIIPLEWDTGFFGLPIGRLSLSASAFDPDNFADALRQAREMNFSCLYFETSFASPESMAFCSRKGFYLVDFKTTLSLSIGSDDKAKEDSGLVDSLREDYYPALEAITDVLSARSRFRFDPHLGRPSPNGFFGNG